MSAFKRIISISLAFAIIISMVTVVSAAETKSATSLEIDYLPEMVTSWESTFYSWGTSILGSFYEDTYYQACWNAIDKCFAGYLGRCTSMAALQNRCTLFNNTIKKQWTASTLLYGLAAAGKYPVVQVAYVSSLGVYSLVDVNNGLVLVNSVGAYAWYNEETESSTSRKDIWLPFSTATSKKQVSVLTKDSLSDLCLTLNQTDRTCSVRDTYINDKRFYIIIDSYNYIYANADGVPYVAHFEATVTDVEYDYIVNEGDTIDNSMTIDNSKVIDLSNGTFNYIDESGKQEFYVDELLFDFSSQSYSADTYNVTYDNDTYNTYNYTWNITYNITNTYVTNIGQTELYEPLELYYALPDGRSSADLTAEDVAGMSFEFADCVNYAKSATDTYLRALYHFDGNTDDSSYFSTQGNFEWVEGASISYMDVGTFDGALYLGPEDHQFKITLPSNIGSGDFSIQFRYYQEGAADTQSNTENSLSIGGTTVLQWDDGSIYNGSGIKLTALAVGVWQEFAVIRHRGILYLYHNGLFIGSGANASAWSGNIVLTLGDTTRASSMIDELRVVNFAIAESGASYTCTSVPYDTNTVLVLPDSAFPIADEYWKFHSSATNLLSAYSLDDWSGMSVLDSNRLVTVALDNSYSYVGYESSNRGYPYWCVPGFVNLGFYDGATISTTSGAVSYYDYFVGSYYSNSAMHNMPNGLFSVIYSDYLDDYGGISTKYSLSSSTYTLSMVSSDGTVGSFTFDVGDLGGSGSVPTGSWVDYIDFNGYRIGIIRFYTYKTYSCTATALAVVPIPSDGSAPSTSSKCTGGEFLYLELIQGASSDLSAERVSCIYSSEEVKPNTAAIQTDIPINGYTVGGVRPTFPARGDVWMPVSNNRITNVYIYNGSAWEEVNARWYTGKRWIPIYGFDLTTLEDCWDIANIDDVIVPVGTEQEFWNWWKQAWTDFRSWLSDSGLGGSGTVVNDKLPDQDGTKDDPNTEEDESEDGYSFLDLAESLVEVAWRVVTGAVKTAFDGIGGVVSSVQYIGDFFQFYDDGQIFQTVKYTGEGSIWD